MSELELRLSTLSEEIAWPETPPLELTVAGDRQRGFRARPLALGIAMLLVVLAGVLVFSPGARSSFLEIFGIEGATVVRVENLPEVEAQEVRLRRACHPLGGDTPPRLRARGSR